MSVKVLLITGHAGAVQGWGDMETTCAIRNALISIGHEADIFFVNNEEEFHNRIHNRNFDIIWSSLYHITHNEDYVGVGDDRLWIGDVLDEKGIPFVGPDSVTLKNLIDKARTHRILSAADIPLPYQVIVDPGDVIPEVGFPAFVKPRYESESTGVSENSIVHSMEELRRQVEYIHSSFLQSALVEEYLPGDELTVTMLGDRDKKLFLPVVNVIKRDGYKKYPVITVDLKVKDLISFSKVGEKYDEIVDLSEKAAAALKCHDHIRIDIREDRNGKPKIIEVNGIPGLNPIKSRSLIIHSMYYPYVDKKENFRILIKKILSSALWRHNLES